MSKCPICHSKKGKRRCLISDSPVCSLCCGKTRNADLCIECRYYQQPKRKYSEVPAYLVPEMDGNTMLEDYGDAIEGALCTYDLQIGYKLKDADAIKIVELLIDRYHFGDVEIEEKSLIILNGLYYVNEVINSDLKGVDITIVVKILGVIRFVAKRRSKTGREYMAIIHKHVGLRVGKGAHILSV